MCVPIDPSPPIREQGVAQGPSIAVTDEDTTMAVDGVFEMDDEFQGHGTQDGSSSDQDLQMDDDRSEAAYDPDATFQDIADFGPLTAIHHPTLLPLKGRVQWLTFGARVQITTLHESSLSFYIDDGEDQPPYEWRRLEALVTDHLTALLDSPRSLPDAGDAASGDDSDSAGALLEKLRVPDAPVPAIVWRDIRGEHEDDPTEFVRELDRIYAILGEPRE
ncbi:hypothetical protein LXA43DRAFT_1037573 [Ganoderma leucocontextum]|nr:hypothetical protein LXA43DRAFT_1037573 [Ganoderma leucocontextum]